MTLPNLQSYADAKRQKAYERYLAGDSQRKIAKALKIPPRTVADWSKKDGWEAERRARKVAAESPNVAAAAAEGAPPLQDEPEQVEGRAAGMERMLRQQQYLSGILADALRQDIEATVAAQRASGKPLTRSQIHQLTTLSNNLFALERKAWRVPEKMEIEDTTPAQKHIDNVRRLREAREAAAKASAPAVSAVTLPN